MNAVDRLAAALSGRYRLERELGAGGMATVYLAEDLKHQRQVAIKVLRPELAAVLGAERFVSEIKTTAALQHRAEILSIVPRDLTGVRDLRWLTMPDDPHVYAYLEFLYMSQLYTVDGVR